MADFHRYAPADRKSCTWVKEEWGWWLYSQLSDGTLNYHNAGKIQASSDPADMRLQRMLGHLTTLVPEDQSRISS